MTYINQLETLCQQCGCKMETEVSLAEHTTFRVGGPCRALVHVNSARTAQTLVQFLRREGIPFAVLGRGSNVIVPDEGFDGVVLLFGMPLPGLPGRKISLSVRGGLPSGLYALLRWMQD